MVRARVCEQHVVGMREVSVMCMHAAILGSNVQGQYVCAYACGYLGDDKDWGGARWEDIKL